MIDWARSGWRRCGVLCEADVCQYNEVRMLSVVSIEASLALKHRVLQF